MDFGSRKNTLDFMQARDLRVSVTLDNGEVLHVDILDRDFDYDKDDLIYTFRRIEQTGISETFKISIRSILLVKPYQKES